MITFFCIFSDYIWLPLLELFIIFVFIWAFIHDILIRKNPGNPSIEGGRLKIDDKSTVMFLEGVLRLRELNLTD